MSQRIFDIIKRHFVGGVLVVVPFILTFWVLQFLFRAVDGILEPVLHNLLGYYRAGLGALTTILIVLLVGLLTRNLIGARVIRLGERMLARVPLIRPIYGASKQLLEVLAGQETDSFRGVALIEYPRKGLYSMCFMSQQMSVDVDGQPKEFISCFVPSTPTPVSGMTVLVPAEEVRAVNMTVEEGIKFLVSGGVASPDLIKKSAQHPILPAKRTTT